jgi:hypothetical protein
MKACHNINTSLMQSIAEIEAQSTLKGSRKTLHELSPHIPPKTPTRKRSSSTNEMLYTDITISNTKNESQQHPCHGSDELPPK